MSGLGTPIEVVIDDDAADSPNFDDKGNLISIDHGDGSVTISLTDQPLERADDGPGGWFENLADKIEQGELSRIAEDLLRGVDEDQESRKEWLEARATGLRMLGLKLEIPGTQGEVDGAPVEGMSKVRHPLLLEAVLRFQANARSELLPTDGPVKIRNDDNNATASEDQLAQALERDLNHYLTTTASEYYPDTDRMLLMLGFGGTTFKKVYYCPLRERPVSESVDATDLIVNNEATDIGNARRITHRIKMRPSVVRRMQLLGVYRDIDLSTPLDITKDAVQQEKQNVEGITSGTINPMDRDRDIYEIYCELNVNGYEHKYKGKESGLEVPYRVTIDVSSREILSITRNYNEDTKDLPVARKWFVKYTYVPGFGFYDIGLLHILGNTTGALTAAWREMLDNGMYANFPGFLIAKSATRQNTNIFRVPPGGGVPVDTGGQPIQSAIMPMPYNAQGMPALMTLVEAVESTGQRIGGTAEIQVGEGNGEMPVGTAMALLDQASKIENSVHKRLHASQAEEFRLLCGVFEEHPESFWQRNYKQTVSWDQTTFLTALRDYDLTPQADPNTASHAQRMMKVMGLKQLQSGNPSMYDPIAVDTVALQTMGYSNPSQFFVPIAAMNQPNPEVLKGIAKAKADQTTADAHMLDAQANMAEVQAKQNSGFFAPKQQASEGGNMGMPDEADMLSAHADVMDAETKRLEVGMRARQIALEEANRAKDRESEERRVAMEFLKELVAHPEGLGMAKPVVQTVDDTINGKVQK